MKSILKSVLFLIITVAILVSSTSCAKKEIKKGFTFTDDLGRTVTVDSPKRVTALLGSFADMWILAGGEICASAEDAWSDFNITLPESTLNIGTTHSPSLEQIFLSNPQFVIASSKSAKHVEMESALSSAGISVAYFDVTDFESFNRVFKIFTDITQRRDLYEKHGSLQKNNIDEIIKRSKEQTSQTILVIRASASSIKAKNSESTLLGKMLKDLGCINIADSDNMILENLSIESISEKNPDRIFIVEMGDKTEQTQAAIEKLFSENPLWQQLDAVKNGKVHFMDKHLYNLKPNARFTEAYSNLEKLLYETD